MDLPQLQIWAPLIALVIAAEMNAARLWRARRSIKGVPASDRNDGSDGPPAALEARRTPSGAVGLGDLSTRARGWIGGHPVEAVMVVAALITGGYVWVVSPGFSVKPAFPTWTPGHPYWALHYVRGLELQAADDLGGIVGVVGAAISLGCFVFSVRNKNPHATRVGLLVAGLSLLCLWQLSMLEAYSIDPAVPLFWGLLILLAWGLDYRRFAEGDLFVWRANLATKVVLVSAALAVTILARFSFLRLQPYGIEGDELKWTVEVVRSMADGEFVDVTEYHLASLPVSFYMQALFVRAFGAGILTARLATAVYSILASAAFLALAWRWAGGRAAWLATLLLGIALLDVSASRLANVESLVKLWPIASLLALTWALDSRRTAGFVAAGVLVGLGLLTYDTVAPLLIVGFVLLFVELVRLRVPVREAIRFTAAYTAPQLFVLPAAATYWFGRLQYYDLEGKGFEAGLLSTLAEHAQELWRALFSRTAGDFLYNREGPLFESLLVPWLICGVLLGILLWKRGRVLWALVLGGLFFLPVPILAQSPMGRVLYPGLPAAYFFMAMAMVAVYSEVRRLLGDAAGPAVMTVAAIGLVQLTLLNQFIVFNEVEDPEDRRIRRALYDIAAEIQDSGALGVFPYMPAAGEPIEDEKGYAIWLGMRSRVSDPFEIRTPLFPTGTSFLPSLATLAPPEAGLSIVWDTSHDTHRQIRDALLATFLRCYPTARLQRGEFFDLYAVDRAALADPECVSADVSLDLAPGSPEAGGRVEFEWRAVGAAPRQVTLVCSQTDPDLQMFEAETMSGPGWILETRFAPQYQGEGFLADPGSSDNAAASIEVALPGPDDYYVWVRTYRRVKDAYGARLSVNGLTADFGARYGRRPAWIWERLGPFPIESSTASVSIARPYSGPPDEFMALFFDAIAITSITSFHPEHDDPDEIVLQTTSAVGPSELEGTISTTLPPGTYGCAVMLRDGDRMVDPWGEVGVRSPTVDFEVAGSDP